MYGEVNTNQIFAQAILLLMSVENEVIVMMCDAMLSSIVFMTVDCIVVSVC